MGLDWDGEAVSQSSNIVSHKEVAKILLESDRAYKCYCSPEELQEMRNIARSQGRTATYNGCCRDRDPLHAPKEVKPVIRLKTPLDGETVILDLVQGEVRVKNATIDDMVLLRGDSTPTYTLAVVVDDYNMGVTHVIRGDDHLTNTFRQIQIYDAMAWYKPQYAHIPLIHGVDGKKMSKRHGDLNILSYRDLGILPEALRNYLLRLGWSYGNKEFITTEDAIKWFCLENIGRSPAKFDLSKLENLNSQYLRSLDNDRLFVLVCNDIEDILQKNIELIIKSRIKCAMDSLKKHSKNLRELVKNALLYAKSRPIIIEDDAISILKPSSLNHLSCIKESCEHLDDWESEKISSLVKEYMVTKNVKLKDIAPILRVSLLGVSASPGIFDVMECLGKKETLSRIDDCLLKNNPI